MAVKLEKIQHSTETKVNIISSSAPAYKAATPVANQANAEVSPADSAAEEPKDSFSLSKTMAAGLLGFMGRRIPTTFPEISPQKAQALKDKIKPGDVLMSTDMAYPGWGRMEHYAVGSEYVHAAMVGSDGKVYEANGEGVISGELDSFLKGRLKFAVVRPGLSEDDVQSATDFARSHLGKKYDGVFNTEDNTEFYCSELVSKAIASGQNPVHTPVSSLFGKKAVAPDAFLKIPGIEVVHDDGSSYWKNKIGYWPVAASTVGMGIAGQLLGGIGGAAVGAGVGFLGSVLVGNKIQTGHFSPMIAELRSGK